MSDSKAGPSIALPNWNDTVGQALQSALGRITLLEQVLIRVPGIGPFAQEALGVTTLADDAIDALFGTPTPTPAIPAPTPAAPKPSAPAPVQASVAPGAPQPGSTFSARLASAQAAAKP